MFGNPIGALINWYKSFRLKRLSKVQKRKAPTSFGVLGYNYRNADLRPLSVIWKGLSLQDQGDGTYKDSEGGHYTYKFLFGNISFPGTEIDKK